MEKYKQLNNFLKEYLIDLKRQVDFETYKLEQFLDQTYIYATRILMQENSIPEKFKNPRKNIKIKDTISLVDDFLSDLDFELERKFKEAIDKNIIHFTSDKKLKNKKETKDNCYFFHSLAGYVESNPFVNVVTHNRLHDAFTLVHEFSHYANMKGEESNLSWHLFTESYAGVFEVMFLDFLKNTSLKEEASRYYLTLLWSFILKSLNYIKEYYAMSIYLTFKSIDDKRIYKYVSDNKNKEEYFSIFRQNMLNIEDKINQYGVITTFLEDSKYVIAVPFMESAIEEMEKRKKEIIDDYKMLSYISHDYYFDKYELEKEKTYEKVFKRGNL